MFQKYGNRIVLIPIMWKNYNQVWKKILEFGFEKKLKFFVLAFIYPTKYKAVIGNSLWKFKIEEGIFDSNKKPPGPDFLKGKFCSESIEKLSDFHWNKFGFCYLQIFGNNSGKEIKFDSNWGIELINFEEKEIEELEKLLKPLQRK